MVADGTAEIVKSLVRPGPSNIRQMAEESILHFPLLVADSVSKETVDFMSKAFENEYANLFRLAVNTDDIVTVRSGDAPKQEFLKKFHTSGFDKSPMVAYAVDKGLESAAHAEMLKPYEKNFNHAVLNDMSGGRRAERKGILSEKSGPRGGEGGGPRLTDVSVKKTNSSTPTIVELDLKYQDEKSREIKDTKMVVGIKCVAHPVPHEEVVHHLTSSLKDGSVLFKAVQWTTGEVSLIHDILFNIEKLKNDAIAANSPTRKWWVRLKQLKGYNRFAAMFKARKFLPSVTLMVSMSEVEAAKGRFGVDLLSPRTVKDVMSSFMLLGFAVCDEAEEVVAIYDEKSGSFARYTYASIKKGNMPEMNMDDFKKLLLFSKGS